MLLDGEYIRKGQEKRSNTSGCELMVNGLRKTGLRYFVLAQPLRRVFSFRSVLVPKRPRTGVSAPECPIPSLIFIFKNIVTQYTLLCYILACLVHTYPQELSDHMNMLITPEKKQNNLVDPKQRLGRSQRFHEESMSIKMFNNLRIELPNEGIPTFKKKLKSTLLETLLFMTSI